MHAKKLPGNETLAAFSVTIMKILEYPFLTTIFISKEYQTVVRLAQEVALVRSRINQKRPMVVRYRSKELAGLRIKNLLVVQGIEKLDIYLSEYY